MIIAAVALAATIPVTAQNTDLNADLQQKLAAVKQSAAENQPDWRPAATSRRTEG
jgi:hypothetical protein